MTSLITFPGFHF